MDRPPLKSLFGFSLATTAIVIGTVNTIIYAGMFIWQFALLTVEHSSKKIPEREFMLSELVIDETFISSLFSICLIIGVNKTQPGFILAWLINQFIIMASSLMTLFYFLLASYLKMPFLQFIIELGVNGIHGFCFLVVYSIYLRLRSGNLSEEEA